MIGFSAEDLSGEKFGGSWYITIAGGISSFIFHLLQQKMHKNPTRSSDRDETVTMRNINAQQPA